MRIFAHTLAFLVAVSTAIFAQNCPFTLRKPVIDGNKVCFAVSSIFVAQLTYSWDFDGDGTFDTTTTDSGVCHTYTTPDTYWAKVKVEDGAGCEKKDSANLIIEQRGYVFVPESLYTIDLSPYTSYNLTGNKILRTEILPTSFVALRRLKNFEEVEDSCHSIFLFYKNIFIGIYPNYIPTFINIGNNIVLNHRKVCESGYEDASILIDTLGNILWQSRYLWYPTISKNDSLIGVYCGDIGGGGDSYPKSIFSWDFYAGATHRVFIINALTGTVNDSIEFEESFTKNMIVGLFNKNVSKFFFLFHDSLVGYNEHLQKQYTISPIINFPPETVRTFWTMPIFEQSKGDGNIYVYASYNGRGYQYSAPIGPIEATFWYEVPESLQYTTVEAVCIDTLGNILWRRLTDSLRVSCFQISSSGRYTIGYTEESTLFRQFIVWNTLSNEILCKKNFPNDSAEGGYHKWIDIFENEESGHAFIRVFANDDTLYYLPDGTEINLDFSQVENLFFRNFSTAFEKQDSLLKIFKARW
jgi:PKD repeat protein